MDAKTYSVFADASYSNDINIIKDKLVKAGLADWKVLKIDDEYVTSNINGFQGVAYGLDSDGDGEYEQIVVACRGSQPPTWTAPLEMLKDWLWADAVQIGSGSNLTQYGSAQDFYNKVLDEYCTTIDENGTTTVDNSKLTITGHSMGGSLAQLLCAQYGNYGVTFNAPGTELQANKMGWNFSNVENYIIMNDIIGNIRDHVGTEYYLDPTETDTAIYAPHSAYTNVSDFSDNHNIGWSFEKSLALFWFDINNNPTIQTTFEAILQLNERVMDLTGHGLIDGYSTLSFESLNNYLKDHVVKSAVETVRDLGTPDLILQYSVTRVGDYIIGDATGGKNKTLEGSNSILGIGGNDTIWGNEGNDEISGLGGNDLIYGDRYDGKTTLAGATYNDTIDGGSGNDKIYGGAGNDSILGGSGKDYIDGGEGRNTLIGGSGVDTYIANSNDVIIDTDGYGSVSLKTAKPVLQALRSSLISVQSWEKNQKIAA